MTATLSTLLLSSVLLAAALGGPWLLRRAAPALAMIPRVAAIVVTLSALLWIAALVALGPLVAWMSSGPAWLPKQAAEVCSRCLSAASPFGESAMTLGIPAIVPLALPALGVLAVLVGLAREVVLLRRSQAAFGSELRAASDSITLLGSSARVTRGAALQAFSLPQQHGGIVLSRGTLAALSPGELSAVLAHEQAHLDQRHHLIMAILNGTTRYFRWIPFVHAVRESVPHYLEIAADQAAKQATGTTALASALLKLGEPMSPVLREVAPGGAGTGTGAEADAAGLRVSGSRLPEHAVLHAAGSERIRHLIGAPRPPASAALAAAAGAYAFMLAAVIAAVNLPYLFAVLSGC
ncbi:M56 family metallopeptidase [Leucobacter sp. BZR 635]